jgi:hypothetical protein
VELRGGLQRRQRAECMELKLSDGQQRQQQRERQRAGCMELKSKVPGG